MAIKFPVNARCYYDNADWMDNQSAFSWAGWVRFDAIDTNAYQYVWAHVGATDRMECYKKRTNPQYVRFQLYAGGVIAVVDDTTGAAAAGTLMHLAVTWAKTTTGGLKIYRNGAFVAQVNTTTQTGNYNSGGSVDLSIGSRNTINWGLCTCEGFGFWPGRVLTAEQIRCLYWSGWPYQVVARPAAFYPMFDAVLNRIPDTSGNSRHIPAAQILGSVSAAGTLGHWDEPAYSTGAFYRQATAGPPPPNSWTLFEQTTHPDTTSTVTSLVNGTAYEFAVSALDGSSNESQLSAIVEKTPSATAVKHRPRRIFVGH